MKLLRGLQRPEYFFRPGQLWRRMRRDAVLTRGEVRLSWGLPIRIDPSCVIGRDILNLGLYDRVVPETICRLLDAGEWALDVGANIGQNASIMALVAGPRGYIVAFEPHPTVCHILRENVVSWHPYDLAPIDTVQKGLSSSVGKASLYEGQDFFSGNRGSASLEVPRAVVRTHEIDVTTLDEFLAVNATIGLAKLDVEGHEHAVLLGGRELLRTGRLRDVIFEDHSRPPTRVTDLLEAAGYSVFKLYARWHGPRLIPCRDALQLGSTAFASMNYLATLDVDRVRARFRRAGWKCLRLQATKAS